LRRLLLVPIVAALMATTIMAWPALAYAQDDDFQGFIQQNSTADDITFGAPENDQGGQAMPPWWAYPPPPWAYYPPPQQQQQQGGSGFQQAIAVGS
jgi:hypothetical protein